MEFIELLTYTNVLAISLLSFYGKFWVEKKIDASLKKEVIAFEKKIEDEHKKNLIAHDNKIKYYEEIIGTIASILGDITILTIINTLSSDKKRVTFFKQEHEKTLKYATQLKKDVLRAALFAPPIVVHKLHNFQDYFASIILNPMPDTALLWEIIFSIENEIRKDLDPNLGPISYEGQFYKGGLHLEKQNREFYNKNQLELSLKTEKFFRTLNNLDLSCIQTHEIRVDNKFIRIVFDPSYGDQIYAKEIVNPNNNPENPIFTLNFGPYYFLDESGHKLDTTG